MSRSFSPASLRDPRVLTRVVIGALLAANLAAAVMAFHPFGGSADDLRRQQQSLTDSLAQARSRLARTQKMADKVQTARQAGDSFMEKYFIEKHKYSAAIVDELVKMATAAGIQMGQANFSFLDIEGSDTLKMESIQVGFEGTYANFTKFVNLIDRSPQFLIIENMTASAPQGQGGQVLNVTLKIDAFLRDTAGAI